MDIDFNRYKDLTELVYKFGPFFLLLFINIYLISQTQKRYRRAINDEDEKEIKTLRIQRNVTFYLGILMCLIVTVWWLIIHNPFNKKFTYQTTIKDLFEYDHITAPDIYVLRDEFEIRGQEGNLKHYNLHFLALNDKEAKEGENMEIYYWKNGSKNYEIFSIPLAQNDCYYKIIWSENDESNVLRRFNCDEEIASRGTFLSTAYAQSRQKYYELKPENKKTIDTRISKSSIGELQFERTEVGKKIEILDKLNNSDTSKIRNYYFNNNYKEPLALTLYELSRHSDSELAFKASKLNKKFNSVQSISSYINFNTNSTEEVLKRLDTAFAKQVVERIEFDLDPNSLEIGVENDKLLKPVGSEKGDRYYVKATWNPNDETVVKCLTALFNKSTLEKRSIEKEQEIMENRKSRTFFWYSKSNALNMAEGIEACGGYSKFIN